MDDKFWDTVLNGSEIKEPILETLSDWAQIDISKLSPEDSIRDDLGLDSLDFLEIVMEIEARLDIHMEDEDVEKCKTVGELVMEVSKAVGNGPRRKWDW